MSGTSVLVGTGKRRRRFEADVKQVTDEFGNKRAKLCSTTTGLAVNDSTVNSPATAASSKCAPLSPLPQQQRDTVAASGTEKLNQKLQTIGSYRLLAQLEGNSETYTAVDTRNGRLVICRRLDRSKYAHTMQLAHRLQTELDAVTFEEDEENKRAYEQIFPAGSETIMGDDGCYYYFEPRNYGSLHAHVVERRRLNEQECLWYFRQILQLVVYCHRRRVVLRDLKLRKFVFADPERLTIRLDGVDELFVCPDKQDDDDDECQEDRISDRHGCPAYVGPEILDLNQKSFSGRAADIWSLGVLLYVALYGRYPFYDTTPARLFAKIRHAHIHVPEEAGNSFDVRSLIRCLLRRDPKERPDAMEIMAHPWLQSKDRSKNSSRRTCGAVFTGPVIVNSATGIRYVFVDKNVDNDQCVPFAGGIEGRGPRKTATDALLMRQARRWTTMDGPVVPSQ